MVADPDAELCRVVNAHVPVVLVRKRMGDDLWFYCECKTAYEWK